MLEQLMLVNDGGCSFVIYSWCDALRCAWSWPACDLLMIYSRVPMSCSLAIYGLIMSYAWLIMCCSWPVFMSPTEENHDHDWPHIIMQLVMNIHDYYGIPASHLLMTWIIMSILPYLKYNILSTCIGGMCTSIDQGMITTWPYNNMIP